MKTLYQRLIDFREVGGDMISVINSHSAREIFEPLIALYGSEMLKFNQAFFYLLMVYSRDSTSWAKGVSYEETKRAVIKELEIEDAQLAHELMDLELQEIRDTVQRYLDYQGSPEWDHLIMIKELYHEMRVSAMMPIRKGEAIDYEQKFKNARYAKELLQEIGAWEAKMMEDEKNYAETRQLLAKKGQGKEKKRHIASLRVEDAILQMRQKKHEQLMKKDKSESDEPEEHDE